MRRIHATSASTPAAFRRLCVETVQSTSITNSVTQPPSGGCVLKPNVGEAVTLTVSSRLQAAVC